MNIQKTRCPHCSSIFTVSDTQLSIRDGYTRCGKCFKVFKADDYLLVEQQPVTPSTPTLFDDHGKATPATISVMATMEKSTKPAPASRPAPLDKPEPISTQNSAEDKLASTLNDQPLATLARMLANELSMLTPQPLLPVAAAPTIATKPVAVEPQSAAEPEPQPDLPEFALDSAPRPAAETMSKPVMPQVESTAPVMSHIFEQEFNDLWLSATDHSKPLASAVATSTAVEEKHTLLSKNVIEIEKKSPQSANILKEEKRSPLLESMLDDGLTEHFNSSASDMSELAAPAAPIPVAPIAIAPAAPVAVAKPVELSDAMTQVPSMADLRAVEEEQEDEEDLFSYLNKNNVAAAPANLRPKRILPGMQAPIDPKAANKTKSRATITHPRQPSSKRTALPPIKRPNVVMDRLTQPMPFFNFNIPKALGWGFLSLIMLVLLGVQYVYFNFDRLAAQPAYSPLLKQMCQYAGCEVPLIDVHKIKITNKQARHYPDSPNDSTRFTATMVNHADSSQPYPSIQVLILKKGEVQSGRIVKPSEYIPSGYTALAKIPANTPVQIRFVLKIPREQISVFALDPI